MEGFEAEAIRGATGLVRKDALQAVLIELNGLGARYGLSDDDVHARLLNFGFSPASYDPFSRRLTLLNHHHDAGNTLYVRSSAELEQRLRQARPVVWGKTQF